MIEVLAHKTSTSRRLLRQLKIESDVKDDIYKILFHATTGAVVDTDSVADFLEQEIALVLQGLGILSSTSSFSLKPYSKHSTISEISSASYSLGEKAQDDFTARRVVFLQEDLYIPIGEDQWFKASGFSVDSLAKYERSIRRILKNIYPLIQKAYKNITEKYTDGLTGLGNKILFDRMLEKPLKDYAIIFIDIDGLKQVNDTGGHNQGDILIQSHAKLLKDVFGPHAEIFRWGGDEFVVVVPFEEPKQDREKIVQKLIIDMETYITEHTKSDAFSDTEIQFSLGIAYNKDGENMKDVTKRADAEMYANKRAKKQGILD